MKTYKEYSKEYIGSSDIATLILFGIKENIGPEPMMLFFGEDGSYYAYIIPFNDVEIGKHYKKITEFTKWLKIYDDRGLVMDINAKKISVYRAGEFGCIIQMTNDEEIIADEAIAIVNDSVLKGGEK